MFAGVLGLGLGIAVELLYANEATTGAQLAYASTDIGLSFHLFSIFTWYLPALAGAIILIALIAAIIPISLGARRNPIKDMRDDG